MVVCKKNDDRQCDRDSLESILNIIRHFKNQVFKCTFAFQF